jgi:molybdate transport system substrate-binding protein
MSEFRVMTSGAFTAAHLALMPRLASVIAARVVTASTSIGTGENSIPNRLKRGEVVDIVIVSDTMLRKFVQDGYVQADGVTVLARSIIAMAVRAGAPKPDIGSADALKSTMLRAKSIGYSASVSGTYVTTELVQRLGIADQVLPKCHFVGNGERVGAVVARGELEIGFQQLSELLPVKGIDHITPLPPDLQKVSSFAAGVAASSPDKARARSAIRFLASKDAVEAIKDSGLEPTSIPSPRERGEG